ncbi:MAG: hypothetical protein IJZ29_03365 [Clostridia bacterium]|nr:hypothetical protein [Clostridia bacterium]
MSKIINEENLQFTDKPLSERLENANVVNNNEKVKIFDSANAKVLTKQEQKSREIRFQIFDKTMIVLNIVTNIAFFFFISEVLNGVIFTGGLTYEFNTFRTVGIIIFALAQLTGLYLLIKMFRSANLKTRLVLVTAPLAIILLAGTWAILNVQNFQGETELAIVDALGLTDFDPATIEFKYILIAVAVYLVLLYVLYGLIFKSANVRTEKKSKQDNKK